MSAFSNTYADLTIENPKKNETITKKIYKVNWKCDSDLLIYIEKNKTVISENPFVNCTNWKYEKEIDFSKAKDWDEILLVVWKSADDWLSINIIYNSKINENKWKSPTKKSLFLEDDSRVKIFWEITDFWKIDENKDLIKKEINNLNKDLENKSLEKKEDIIEIILENGNKFTHKKLSCQLPQNIKENLKKELKTNFIDIENFKFKNEIKNLENLKVVVWTSKNIFENREITKFELLWLILKANCYDVSTTWDWREKVLEIWLENNIIDIKDFKNYKNISKKNAFEMILKWGKITTPKNSWTENMKYLWVFNENEKIQENINLYRNEAINILVNILKLYK